MRGAVFTVLKNRTKLTYLWLRVFSIGLEATCIEVMSVCTFFVWFLAVVFQFQNTCEALLNRWETALYNIIKNSNSISQISSILTGKPDTGYQLRSDQNNYPAKSRGKSRDA